MLCRFCCFIVVKYDLHFKISPIFKLKIGVWSDMTPCCLVTFTNVSEELAASDFRVSLIKRLDCPEKGGNKFLQISVANYQSTRRHIPEDSHLHQQRSETSNHRNFNGRLSKSVSYIMGWNVYIANLYPIFTDYFKLSWENRKSEKNFTQALNLYCKYNLQKIT
jgi:hypothetical protein